MTDKKVYVEKGNIGYMIDESQLPEYKIAGYVQPGKGEKVVKGKQAKAAEAEAE